MHVDTSKKIASTMILSTLNIKDFNAHFLFIVSAFSTCIDTIKGINWKLIVHVLKNINFQAIKKKL